MSWRYGGVKLGPLGGGPEVYGPTAGRSSVITNAAPRTVTDPGNAIEFNSASDLQSKILSNAASSNFKPSAGWSDWNSRVLPSNKDPRIWVPGAPGTRTFDAADRLLFSMIGGGSATDRMEIHGGTWQNVGNASGGGHVIAAGPNSKVLDVIVVDAYNAGIRISGNNVEIGYFKAQDNGADGVSNPGLGTGALVHHGEFFGNGHRDPDAVPDHGGSGKWSGGAAAAGIIEHCYTHESFDYGWWNDGAGSLIVRESVAEDCRKTAPFFEIIAAGGEIHHCWLARNGEAATGGEFFFANVVTVACCNVPSGQELYIHHNHIEGAERLVALNNQTSRPNTHRIRVETNRIKATATSAILVGGVDSQAVDTLFTEPTITFNFNKYIAPSLTPQYFQWPGALTFAQWQALGYDASSTLEIG